MVGLLVGCDERNSESDIAAIDEIWRKYESSINAGDAVKWGSLWMDDGIQMPPGTKPILGRKSIEKSFADFLITFDNHQDLTILETLVSGDWAFSRGTWISTLTPKQEGQSYLIDGKFVTVFRRQVDGSWKIYRNIHNSNTASFVTPID